MPVRGKVVVVTGASAGVGRAVARMCAERGDRVALLARGPEGLHAAADDVRARGGQALALSVDMADAQAVDRAAEEIEQQLGPIDVWINDAFSSVFAPVAETSDAEFRRTTEVSYLGFVYGTKAALARMLPRDRGAIVQVGSALAHRGIPLQAAYCASKHAIEGFTESLRCELLHDRSRVRVTMVALPAVNTPQFDWVLSRLPRRPQPVPPIYQPEVAARAILFAADHPGRREYLVGWSTVLTVIANRVAAGLLDRYLARTGYASQQTDGQPQPGRPANLWQPADTIESGDFGAHGSFDDRSYRHTSQQVLSRHRRGLLIGLGVVTGSIAAARVARRRRGAR
ncbi:MAG TPA: SDR family oxidoreductase [Micromonosporaceae bacterium]